jgi:hypothetical protein
LDTDQHGDNQERKERGRNAGGEFRFKPHPLSITGADGDDLKYTQERGGAEGKTTCNLISVQPTSLNKCPTPKDDIVSGVNLNMMVKTLTSDRCVKITYRFLQMPLKQDGVHM